ncbi:MAG: undecaprenyldiphospho-muramoylpentapeptide beta-N-acetylglucosaminyltransferase [Actinomycetota bacterium]
MNVVIAGGGTAGHVFPALAVARRLVDDHGADVRFIGTDRGLERDLVPEAGFDLTTIGARPFVRKISVDAARAPIALLRSVSECRPLTDAADVILGMGGYASAPAVMAARRGHRPVVVHEQNAIPGAANRLAARWARVVCVSFEEARDRFPDRVRTVVTGNPVRQQVLEMVRARDELREEARAAFGFDPQRKTVVVFGGSQGAKHLNETVAAACRGRLASRLDLQVLILAGWAHADAVRAAVGSPADGRILVHVLPFLDRMELAYAVADLVVCRSGATTLAEISVSGLPSILIPYPHATANHQEANARALERAGGATVLLDAELTSPSLSDRITDVLDQPARLDRMAADASGWAKPGAAATVADIVVGEIR